MTVLSLCDDSGVFSEPYREAGYDVLRVDLSNGADVRLFKALPYRVRGVIAQPPCTHLASSGARWWAGKGQDTLLEALAVVDACMRIIAVHQPQWWVLENPVGRLRDYLGEPRMAFDPCDYGDTYTKRTLLWGHFAEPLKVNRVEPVEGSKMHLMPPSEERAKLRSLTPGGFCSSIFRGKPMIYGCQCRREPDGSEYTCERCEEHQDFERFTETFALLHRLLVENHDITDGGAPGEHPHQVPNWAMRCTRLLEEIEDEFMTASGLKAAHSEHGTRTGEK